MQQNQFFDFFDPNRLQVVKSLCTDSKSLMFAQKPATSRLLAPRNPCWGRRRIQKSKQESIFLMDNLSVRIF